MLNKKKIFLCVILARGGSKSVKNKNILDLNGHPLISYTIFHAIKSRVFEDIIVSTNDKRIKKISAFLIINMLFPTKIILLPERIKLLLACFLRP